MIILDKALEERARADAPVRIGLVGAGFMGRGIAASTVATRTLVVLGQDLVPYRKRAREENGGAAEGVEDKPKLRLNDAQRAQSAARTIKRA